MKKALRCLGYIYIGDEQLPGLCGDYFISQRIPIKQPGFNGK